MSRDSLIRTLIVGNEGPVRARIRQLLNDGPGLSRRLLCHLVRPQLPQLIINERQKFLGGFGVALLANYSQTLGNLECRRHKNRETVAASRAVDPPPSHPPHPPMGQVDPRYVECYNPR